MLLVTCPWCGPRAETEFSCGGEADIARPLAPDTLTDREWGDYLFMRHNPRGLHREQWLHVHGCRRWFKATRDTVTYRFEGVEPFRQPYVTAAEASDPPAAPAASKESNAADADAASNVASAANASAALSAAGRANRSHA